MDFCAVRQSPGFPLTHRIRSTPSNDGAVGSQFAAQRVALLCIFAPDTCIQGQSVQSCRQSIEERMNRACGCLPDTNCKGKAVPSQ
jgi:hypothetical protein